MAHLLARLGEAALKPQLVGGVWRKAAISAKNAARLRREWLLAGKEWPYEKEAKEGPSHGQRGKPKGHKHDREKPLREKAIEARMQGMEERVAAYRRSTQLQPAPLLDRLLSTPKQLRLKQRAGGK